MTEMCTMSNIGMQTQRSNFELGLQPDGSNQATDCTDRNPEQPMFLGSQNGGQDFYASEFAETMTYLSNLDDHTYQPAEPATTIDPADLCSTSPRSLEFDLKQEQLSESLPTVDPRLRTSEAPTTATTTTQSSSPPPESASSLRARYVVEQRHQKKRRDSRQTQVSSSSISSSSGSTRKLSFSEKQDRHREKNKIAASKCRARKKKQLQSVQDRSARMSDSNAELKACVEELRQELNGLRGLALGHQGCDCQVAQYNCSQARRIAAEYRDGGVGSAIAA